MRGAPPLAALLLFACDSSAPPTAPAAAQSFFPPFTVRGRLEEAQGLRYRIELAPGPLAEADFRALIERALAVWSATGIATFEEGAGAVDLEFSWARAGSADNPGGRFGRDTSVATTGPVGPGCAIVFDAGRPWSEGSGGGASLFQAAVHEIGHALGLGHVEDPSAVLHPQRENGRSRLSPGDLAGLQSLYGGGSEGPGDLVIEAARPVPALRRTAPPDVSDWALFDTDGDGDDEILVWAIGARAPGVLTAYHFSAGPLLQRTVGPVLGIGGYGSRVTLGRTPDGERCLDVAWPDSSVSRWCFGDDGVPGRSRPLPPQELLPSHPAAESLTGDLDGDAVAERIRRVP